MAVSRREFLIAPAALAATAMLPGGLLASVAAETPALPDLSSWERVRAQFALDPSYLHFASFFISSHPAPVRAAIDGYRRAMDRNPFHVIEEGMFAGDEHNVPLQVQREIAAYLGGRAEDICLTRSTTEGLALIYHGLPLQPGDEVLCTTHDHYSHHESARLATQRAGATLRKIALFDDAATATTASLIAKLLAGIGPSTRVVGLTWVHSSSGIRLPIRELAAALRARRGPPVLLVVDGVHGIGAVDETIATMGCDYFCAGTHKWMFGPRGTGLIWANAENWARLRPTIPTFSELESYEAWMQGRAPAAANNASRMTPGGFHAFEHQWATAAAFRMHQQMGRARVAARIRSLNDQLKAGLAGNPKVRVRTPMSGDLSAGLVAFEVDGVAPPTWSSGCSQNASSPAPVPTRLLMRVWPPVWSTRQPRWIARCGRCGRCRVSGRTAIARLKPGGRARNRAWLATASASIRWRRRLTGRHWLPAAARSDEHPGVRTAGWGRTDGWVRSSTRYVGQAVHLSPKARQVGQ